MSGILPTNVQSANGSGVVTGQQLNSYAQWCANITQLRGFVGLTGMVVMLQGITAAGDGGAGLFYYAQGSSYTDDGVNTIVPTAATGQGAWLRAYSFYSAPKYLKAALPVVTSGNQGQLAYCSNGRNTGEGAGSGTGCLVTVNSAGVWAAVWSGVAVTV